MTIRPMGTMGQTLTQRLREAVDAGELGLWDLRPELETVHYSPQWKSRLGFPDPHRADSTHFWRCRVHPADLEGMLMAMRAHASRTQPGYEATFRLRSNGSGYRVMHSRGRVVEWSADGRATRMVGTMVDLTQRPCTPQGGLATGPRGAMGGSPLVLPFHQLLSTDTPETASERQRLFGELEEMLEASLVEVEGLRGA
jgi:hypothetical protein